MISSYPFSMHKFANCAENEDTPFFRSCSSNYKAADCVFTTRSTSHLVTQRDPDLETQSDEEAIAKRSNELKLDL